MSQKMKRTLQAILNSMENPAFIQEDDVIIFINDPFVDQGFTQENYELLAKERGLRIKTKILDEGLALYELLDNDIYLLQLSQIKLNKAMALL